MAKGGGDACERDADAQKTDSMHVRLTWWHWVIIVLAFAILASILILIVKGTAVPVDTGVFFGELGSVMGAVFAAAGLVIVIVALLSLGTIQRITTDAATEAVTEKTKEIDANLSVALAAYDFLATARQLASASPPDFRQAEHFTEMALATRSDLPNAREWIAGRLAQAAFDYFLGSHFNDAFRSFSLLGTDKDFAADTYGAIRWFKEAIEKTGDERGETPLRADLARMYGLAGNAEDMLRQIQTIEDKERDALLSANMARLCLSGALVKSADYDRARQLLTTVFPLDSSRIAEAWNARKKQYTELGRGMERMGVWVLRKSDVPNVAPLAKNPGVVWLMPYADSQVALQWRKDAQEVVRVPEPVSDSPDLDGALRTLYTHFTPVCIVEGDVAL